MNDITLDREIVAAWLVDFVQGVTARLRRRTKGIFVSYKVGEIWKMVPSSTNSCKDERQFLNFY